MAIKLSNRFQSNGRPAFGRPFRPMGGCTLDVGLITDPALGLNDWNAFVPVPTGAKQAVVFYDFPDLDTNGAPALDADIVLRRVVNGVTTDTILFNAGTTFQSAAKNWFLLDLTEVGGDDDSVGEVGLLVNTAAATAGTGAARLSVVWL